MSTLIRVALSAFVFLAVYLFSFWVVFALIFPAGIEWLATFAAFLAASAASSWIWRTVGTDNSLVFQTALRWALIAGGFGFCAGFFGPLIIYPEANLGPLLGIFITGPFGFVAGGIAGLVYALVFNSKTRR